MLTLTCPYSLYYIKGDPFHATTHQHIAAVDVVANDINNNTSNDAETGSASAFAHNITARQENLEITSPKMIRQM